MKQPVGLCRSFEIQTFSSLLALICVHHVDRPASAFAQHRHVSAIPGPGVTDQDASRSFVGGSRHFVDARVR